MVNRTYVCSTHTELVPIRAIDHRTSWVKMKISTVQVPSFKDDALLVGISDVEGSISSGPQKSYIWGWKVMDSLFGDITLLWFRLRILCRFPTYISGSAAILVDGGFEGSEDELGVSAPRIHSQFQHDYTAATMVPSPSIYYVYSIIYSCSLGLAVSFFLNVVSFSMLKW